MKKKNFSKKLFLNKEAISKLDLINLKGQDAGGATDTYTRPSYDFGCTETNNVISCDITECTFVTIPVTICQYTQKNSCQCNTYTNNNAC